MWPSSRSRRGQLPHNGTRKGLATVKHAPPCVDTRHMASESLLSRGRSAVLAGAIFVLVTAGTVVAVNESSGADSALPALPAVGAGDDRARSLPGPSIAEPDSEVDGDDVLADDGRETGGQDSSSTTTAPRTASEADSPAGDESAEGPYADPRRLVLAAYYPWFHTEAYQRPTLADRPVEPSDVYRDADVLHMTRQARAHGIDGFVVSWAGHEENGHAFDLALDAAAATDGYATAYLETRGANAARDPGAPADPDVVRAWLYGAVARADHPAFLKHEGEPVVFVYAMRQLSPQQWEAILDDFEDAGLRVRLVGDGSPDHFDVRWGWHRYAINDRSAEDVERATRWIGEVHRSVDPVRLTVATVSPGYDDTKLRGDANPVVERGPNGERYAAVWDAALAADPDWVFITSWNEWYEGTSVQPGAVEGDLALRQTATYAARFKG